MRAPLDKNSHLDKLCTLLHFDRLTAVLRALLGGTGALVNDAVRRNTDGTTSIPTEHPRDRLTLDSQSVATRQRPAKSANKTRGEAVNPVRS